MVFAWESLLSIDGQSMAPDANRQMQIKSRDGAGRYPSGESLMSQLDGLRTRFEASTPILKVADMSASVRYYVDVLGFKNGVWGNDDFTAVNRDSAGIYLCRGGQGQAGTWAWIGVEDVEALHEEYKASGAKIRHPPANYPWALEMKVEDPGGQVLRFGSEPKTDRPFDPWSD